jgi:hypothetical protein
MFKFCTRKPKETLSISLRTKPYREWVELLVMEEFLSLSPQNWSKNRPPDERRIDKIKKFMVDNSVDIVSGLLYVWKNGDKYTIYDGIHRYLATKNLKVKVMVRFVETSNENIIISDFIQLNKSIPVPFLYIEDSGEMKRRTCENLAQKLCSTYPRFVSSSRRHAKYNFNRDLLIDFLATLDIDFTKPDNEEKLWNELVGLNIYAKSFVRDNKIECPKKCYMYQFFLFYLDEELIKKRLEISVDEK